jgi:hypothetical protein
MTVHGKQMTFSDISDEYAQFVEKFKPKKTTDDCYTPENIYEAVLDWAAARYGFDKAKAVRPFWPGGDYEAFDYPDSCVVVDNPPFSILSKIVRFYMRHGVDFFLFAPALTTFVATESGASYVCCGASITYENGAVVNTSFVTSMGEVLVETSPALYQIIKGVDDTNRRQKTKQLRKYVMPDCVATAARLNWLAVHGTEFRIRREDAVFIRDLDCRCELFGGAFLLSERAAAERAAAERAAAERAAAERAALSPRELKIQKMLGNREALYANPPFFGGEKSKKETENDGTGRIEDTAQ